MENKRLLETLKQLHVELSQAERVDPETLDLLETLTDDIERVLSKASGRDVGGGRADVEIAGPAVEVRGRAPGAGRGGRQSGGRVGGDGNLKRGGEWEMGRQGDARWR